MNRSPGSPLLLFMVTALLSAPSASVQAQSVPASATAAAATAPATAASTAASAPARKPSFDQLLAGKTAPFDFVDTPVNQVIDALGRNYGVQIENNYQKNEKGVSTPVIIDNTMAKPDKPAPVPLVTAKIAGEISVRDALGIINATIMPFGYTAVESVRLDPQQSPYGVVTIMPTRKDAGASRPVFYGLDPTQIPEGDQLRTQVITLNNLDLSKAREIVSSVLAKNADITVNADRNTLIITDTETHVHSAVTVLQILENQAAPKK